MATHTWFMWFINGLVLATLCGSGIGCSGSGRERVVRIQDGMKHCDLRVDVPYEGAIGELKSAVREVSVITVLDSKFREYHLVEVGSGMPYLVIGRDSRSGTVLGYGFCSISYDGVFIPREGEGEGGVHGGRGLKGEAGTYVSFSLNMSLFEQMSRAGGFLNAGNSLFWGPRGHLDEWWCGGRGGMISVATYSECREGAKRSSGIKIPSEVFIFRFGADRARIDPYGFTLYFPEDGHRVLRVSKDGWCWSE